MRMAHERNNQPVKKMIRQKAAKHTYQRATGHSNLLPFTGIVCFLQSSSFAVRFDKNDTEHRPELVQS